MHDDLRARFGLRLQKNRVHIDDRVSPSGKCLQGLGAAYFTTIDGHRCIVRHVLRFERSHTKTPPRKGTGNACHDHGLANV